MINDIMSKNIIYSDINDSIKDVAILMKTHNIGFIPIKDEDKYVGVITDRDIALSLPFIKSVYDLVKSYMSNNIIFIDINSSIDDALNTMRQYKIKRLLVKEKDKIIGILSLSDILNYTNNNNIIVTYKYIFSINDNKNVESAEIDEFYL